MYNNLQLSEGAGLVFLMAILLVACGNASEEQARRVYDAVVGMINDSIPSPNSVWIPAYSPDALIVTKGDTIHYRGDSLQMDIKGDGADVRIPFQFIKPDQTSIAIKATIRIRKIEDKWVLQSNLGQWAFEISPDEWHVWDPEHLPYEE